MIRFFKQAFQIIRSGITDLRSSFFFPEGQKPTTAKATDSDIVMACVHWVMRTFPEAPVILTREVEERRERVPKHPFLELIRRPNPFYSLEALWQGALLGFIIDGNGYWLKVRNGMGQPAELWWAPHWTMTPMSSPSTTNFIDYYRYSSGGGRVQDIPVEDVIHFRFGFDPENVKYGMSQLKAAAREIWSDTEASQWTATLLKNSGVPGLVVSPDGKAIGGRAQTVSTEDAQANKEYFQERTTGDKRGEVIAMTGPTKVEQFGFSPSSMNLKDIRRLPEERITALLGIPAIVAGLGAGLDRSTFANFHEAREMAYESNIIPTQRIMAGTLADQLLSEFEPNIDPFEVGFDLSRVRVLQEDQNKLSERMTNQVRGGYTEVAEARETLGLPVRDSDRVYLRSLVQVEVPGGEAAPTPGSDDDDKAGFKQRRTPTQKELQAVDLYTRTFERLSKTFQATLEPIFVALGRDIAAAAADELKGVGLEIKQDEMTVRQVTAIMDRADVEKHQGQMLNAMKGQFLVVMKAIFGNVSAVLDMQIELPDHIAREIVSEGGRRMGLIDFTPQTRTRLFREILASREAGEGFEVLARKIRDLVPAGRWTSVAQRAKQVARTETKHAQRVSVLRGYAESGVVKRVIVLDARLGDSDEDCEYWNGRTVTLDEAEALAAAEHPNGTRDFAPIIE